VQNKVKAKQKKNKNKRKHNTKQNKQKNEKNCKKRKMYYQQDDHLEEKREETQLRLWALILIIDSIKEGPLSGSLDSHI